MCCVVCGKQQRFEKRKMIETIIEWFRNITFLQIIDFVGTFAFAISGIRLASAKRFDWFGAYVVGAATAIGGGTLRDVMLDVPVFWMHDGFYLACTGFALLWVIRMSAKLPLSKSQCVVTKVFSRSMINIRMAAKRDPKAAVWLR